MLLTDSHGTPIGLEVGSASPHEVTLIESLVTQSQIKLPCKTRLLYDRAADSNPLRQRLRSSKIRLIAPFRRRRNGERKKLNNRDQDLYSHRWKVERTFSWLKNFRRLTSRWEFHVHLFEGFWQLGCLFTILRRF